MKDKLSKIQTYFYDFHKQITSLNQETYIYDEITNAIFSYFPVQALCFYHQQTEQKINIIHQNCNLNQDSHYRFILNEDQTSFNIYTDKDNFYIFPLAINNSFKNHFICFYIDFNLSQEEYQFYDYISKIISSILLNNVQQKFLELNFQTDIFYQFAFFQDHSISLQYISIPNNFINSFPKLSTAPDTFFSYIEGGIDNYKVELKKALSKQNNNFQLQVKLKNNEMVLNQANLIKLKTGTSIWSGNFSFFQNSDFSNIYLLNSYQNEFIRNILNSLSHPFYVIDVKNYNVILANAACNFDKINNYSKCYTLTHKRNEPCDSSEHPCPLSEVLRTKKTFKTNHIHYDKNGNEIFVEVTGYPLINENNEITHMIEYSLDITDRIKAETALQGSQIKYHSIVSSLSEGILLVDQEGIISECNKSASIIFNISKINIITKKLNNLDIKFIDLDKNLIYPDNNPLYLSFYNKTTLSNYIIGIVKNNSSSSWLSINCRFINDDIKGITMVISFTDITSQIEDQEKLRQLSKAVEQSENSIIISDLHGNIQYVNPKFTKLTGYTEKESIGRKSLFLNQDFLSQDEHEDFWQTISKGNVWNGELQYKKKNNQVYWELATFTPIKDSSGRISHYLSIKEDITDKKKQEEELYLYKSQLEEIVSNRTQRLQSMAEELKKANLKLQNLIEKEQELAKLKDEFTSNINHELKTPLTSILMASQYLKKRINRLSIEQIDERVNRIYGSGKHLLNLVNKLLDFSKLEAGKVTCTIEEIDIKLLFDDLKGLFQDLAQDKGLNFTTKHPRNIKIFNDKDHLHTILNNLLGNAFKFTEKGFVELGCEQDQNFIYFFVEDSGYGIGSEEIKTIFDRFKQGTIQNNKAPGTGIGLHIVKSLTEFHGGTVRVVSKIDKGSIFTVSLPYESKWPH